MSFFDVIKNNPKYSPNNSANWFRKNVTNYFNNLGQLQFMGMNQPLQTRTITPGTMAFFGYDPKYKEELPFYDKFPLILPFSMDATHFTGINLHYLPPPKRLIVLDKLADIKSNKQNNDKMKIQLSWQMLSALSEHKAIQHSVKKYLKGHVKTNFINIPVDDWPIAIFLPLARFAKATEQQVWKGMY